MNFSISCPFTYYSLIGSTFTYQMSPQTQELFGWDLLLRLASRAKVPFSKQHKENPQNKKKQMGRSLYQFSLFLLLITTTLLLLV